MIDLASIQNNAERSAEIAALMAQFEASNGRIKTSPVRIGDPPRPNFCISVPGKNKPVSRLRALDGERIALHLGRKAKALERIDKVRALAGRGATIAAMATAAGITPSSIMRMLREHSIVRGPQIDLEAAL